MKFLDRKEQVLELKMTQYGKSLLSRGVFKPVYYSFHDDDVIYDSQYMSSGSAVPLEHSSKAADRIRSAVRTEVQHNHAGVETNIAKLSEVTKVDIYEGTTSEGIVFETHELSLAKKLQELSKPSSPIDSYYSMGLPMGTSDYNSNKAPSWDLYFSSGEIYAPVLNYTGSSGLLRIPQVEVEVYYDVEAKQFVTEEDKPQESDNIVFLAESTYYELKKDHILINFGEHNSLFENENFDIEVYEIPSHLDSEEEIASEIKPLYFINGKKVENDVYYSEGMNENITVQEQNVEYYFDIRVDDEIGDDVGLVDSVSISSTSENIYKTTPENDKEPC